LEIVPEKSLGVTMNEVLISVVILNYRRREALVKALQSVQAQSYGTREIVVVDNGSEDDLAQFLIQNFPGVRLVGLDTNAGCEGRNRGVLAAQGSLVVTIDNDLYFDSPFELQKLVNAFNECPEASCIVLKVLQADNGRLHVRDWCHPRSYRDYADTEFETYFIPEGACAFRREHFLEVGGYFGPLWLGHEGWDLALRMLDRGQHIFYRPSIRVWHQILSETRTSWRPYYYYTRNYIWIAARNYSHGRGLWFLAEKIGMMAYFAIRTRNLKAFARGISHGLRGLPLVWKTRRVLSASTWLVLKQLGSRRPSLAVRFNRHRTRPLI
jgi:GT2 family glycosyltransferase